MSKKTMILRNRSKKNQRSQISNFKKKSSQLGQSRKKIRFITINKSIR